MENMNQIARYEEARKLLSLQLVNKRLNPQKYAAVPSKDFLDLAVVAVIAFPSNDDSSAYSRVNESLLKAWQVPFEQVYADALRNFMKEKTVLVNMEKMLASMGIDVDLYNDNIPLYVLTNDKSIYGAAHILKSEVLEEFASEQHSDIWVLPSSVHETILLSSRDVSDMDSLTEIVQSVNSEVVALEDVLSDHAYLYKRRLGWIDYLT